MSEETLIQSFTCLSPEEQLTFVNSIRKPENHVQVLSFPLQTKTIQNLVQLIMSMYKQVMCLCYDQGITESFLGFVITLSQYRKLNYPKFRDEYVHEQLTNFNSL